MRSCRAVCVRQLRPGCQTVACTLLHSPRPATQFRDFKTTISARCDSPFMGGAGRAGHATDIPVGRGRGVGGAATFFPEEEGRPGFMGRRWMETQKINFSPGTVSLGTS